MDVFGSNWIVIGRFGKPQGIKGFVRVQSFTEPRENLLGYADWFIQSHNKKEAPIKIERVEEKLTPQGVLAQIKGFNSREDVAQLTNRLIAVPKDVLPALASDEFYWHELEGMRVVHESGQVLGTVDSIFATGANDVLVVIGENKKHLIPYLWGDVIRKVDRNLREIIVSWDEDF